MIRPHTCWSCNHPAPAPAHMRYAFPHLELHCTNNPRRPSLGWTDTTDVGGVCNSHSTMTSMKKCMSDHLSSAWDFGAPFEPHHIWGFCHSDERGVLNLGRREGGVWLASERKGVVWCGWASLLLLLIDQDRWWLLTACGGPIGWNRCSQTRQSSSWDVWTRTPCM